MLPEVSILITTGETVQQTKTCSVLFWWKRTFMLTLNRTTVIIYLRLCREISVNFNISQVRDFLQQPQSALGSSVVVYFLFAYLVKFISRLPLLHINQNFTLIARIKLNLFIKIQDFVYNQRATKISRVNGPPNQLQMFVYYLRSRASLRSLLILRLFT